MESLKWIALWFAAFALALILLLNIYPRMLTGSYADITIDHISVDKNGQYGVNFSSLTAAHTTLLEGFYEGDKYRGGGSGGNGGYLGWPIRGSVGVSFGLDPEAMADRLPRGPRPDRLLIHEGEKRRLYPGERLYFYDFTPSHGVRYYGYVEVENYQPRPRMIGWPW